MKRIISYALAVVIALCIGFILGVAAERWANDLSAYEEHY